jgi:hypothetical protein
MNLLQLYLLNYKFKCDDFSLINQNYLINSINHEIQNTGKKIKCGTQADNTILFNFGE